MTSEKVISLLLGPRKIPYEFEWINPGKGTIGSPEDEKGRSNTETQFDCTFTSGFWMGRTLVTEKHWAAVTEDFAEYNDISGDLPVCNINWFEAIKFCEKLQQLNAHLIPTSYAINLPTEAMWEYSCRAGTKTIHYAGNDESSFSNIAWYDGNSGGSLHAVALKEPNA